MTMIDPPSQQDEDVEQAVSVIQEWLTATFRPGDVVLISRDDWTMHLESETPEALAILPRMHLVPRTAESPRPSRCGPRGTRR